MRGYESIILGGENGDDVISYEHVPLPTGS
jgi:hypothetical protein